MNNENLKEKIEELESQVKQQQEHIDKLKKKVKKMDHFLSRHSIMPTLLLDKELLV